MTDLHPAREAASCFEEFDESGTQRGIAVATELGMLLKGFNVDPNPEETAKSLMRSTKGTLRAIFGSYVFTFRYAFAFAAKRYRLLPMSPDNVQLAEIVMKHKNAMDGVAELLNGFRCDCGLPDDRPILVASVPGKAAETIAHQTMVAKYLNEFFGLTYRLHILISVIGEQMDYEFAGELTRLATNELADFYNRLKEDLG